MYITPPPGDFWSYGRGKKYRHYANNLDESLQVPVIYVASLITPYWVKDCRVGCAEVPLKFIERAHANLTGSKTYAGTKRLGSLAEKYSAQILVRPVEIVTDSRYMRERERQEYHLQCDTPLTEDEIREIAK